MFLKPTDLDTLEEGLSESLNVWMMKQFGAHIKFDCFKLFHLTIYLTSLSNIY